MANPRKYKQLVYDIIGAAMEVHEQIGGGVLEAVYQEALSMELADRNIQSEREKELEIFYKGRKMEKTYRMDLVVGDIVLELKSVKEVSAEHRHQLINYLRLTHKPIGILINFGTNSLYSERWCFNESDNTCQKLSKDMLTLEQANLARCTNYYDITSEE